MRNIIWYYYQIRYEKAEERNGVTLLQTEKGTLLFKEVYLSEEEIKKNIEVVQFYSLYSHQILYNIEGKIITSYQNKNYCLMAVLKEEQFFPSFASFEVRLDEVKMGELWSKKIDYYMQQLRELGMHKELLINAFNYYVGMAENAIAMVTRLENQHAQVKYSLQHRRVSYPIDSIHYYDPTTYVIDARVRDMAEYTKAKFFKDQLSLDELMDNIQVLNLTTEEVKLLYARLFYPTYFFDLFEDSILTEEESKEVIRILERQEEYENFLHQFFLRLKSTFALYEVEWIKK